MSATDILFRLSERGMTEVAGVFNFNFESAGKIIFDVPQDFQIAIDFIAIGTGCIERICVAEIFYENSIASKSDLLMLKTADASEYCAAYKSALDRVSWMELSHSRSRKGDKFSAQFFIL